MKKQVIFLFFIFFMSYQGVALSLNSYDSLGVSTMNGENYIIHEVEAGETLYALSRRYNVEVQSIKDANDDSINSLSIGQKVLIPYNINQDTRGEFVHTVQSSETLFSISRLYDTKVDDLKNWNKLTENSISIGQELIIKRRANNSGETNTQSTSNVSTNQRLHIVEESQTLYSISRMYGVSTDQIRKWNNLNSNSLNIGQELIVSSAAANITERPGSNSSMLPENPTTPIKNDDEINIVQTQPIAETTIASTTSTESFYRDDLDEDSIEKPAEKVVEKGLAEVIEPVSETKKYLALHREAPVGTIMQVKNEMNGQSVFVRIVGPIQPTGDNSKVILKISKKAYDRLGAIDKRFPVEISYIP